jgi:hypothetical protein
MNRPSRPVPTAWQVDRRDFLKASAAALFGLAAGGCNTLAAARGPALRFGLLTDFHYADANPSGTRYYRESLGKVREAVGRLREERVEFLAALGDLKDMAAGEPDSKTLTYLVAIEDELRKFGGPLYHLLGNHDMDNLSKPQVLATITNTGITPNRGFYAFSRGGVRFVALDACHLEDGRDYDHGNFDYRNTWVPAAQLAWLRAELAAAREPVIVLCHQRLDAAGDPFVKNSAEVRAALEASGKVLAAFHGHDHPGAHTVVNGIHYYTLKAVVEGSGPENNSYAVAEVRPDLGIAITGYRKAVSVEMVRGGLG